MQSMDFSFLVKYGYAGDGRWNYVLDRKGNDFGRYNLNIF